MKGSYRIEIENRRLRYDFTIRRNITVIRGDSGTGKTTLIAMLRSYEENGRDSGITLHCDRPCLVFNTVRWRESRDLVHDSIIFIDEGQHFVATQEFAHTLAHSDNYFVLVTRVSLENLPYSVEEIYGIRASQKYAGLKKAYNELYRIYYPQQVKEPAQIIVTEDSSSGHQFFQCAYPNLSCISAGGKSNIAQTVRKLKGKRVLIIADGAAFGPEMERMEELILHGHRIILYLPESFEWLILTSDLLHDPEIRDILLHPEDFIDGKEYISWERFFTHLLVQKTQKTYLAYSKSTINPNYLKKKMLQQICSTLPEAIRPED